MDDRRAAPPPHLYAPPAPRRIGFFNGRGAWTLYAKEVRRFLKVWQQTLMAPVVTTLLFLAIFTLALGGDQRAIAGTPFDQFLAPGLVMMAVAQNAFANTSSSLVISKVQGSPARHSPSPVIPTRNPAAPPSAQALPKGRTTSPPGAGPTRPRAQFWKLWPGGAATVTST